MPTLSEALEPHYKTYNMKDLIAQLEALTPTETLELVSALEEKWNVNATSAVQSLPVPSVQLVAEVQTEFNVSLINFGSNKISAIKEVRAITGLGLAEAKAAVESVAAKGFYLLKEGISAEEAEKIKKQLEGIGASVEIK